ncbi:MAG: rRNA maturation RNase YbeY [Prevotellaceae bacterium]|jgi:rRNA maturation RNase YbeY|nr:rRNA maturation RNase YbeY [Prevotellaceae bacterium]
MIRFFTENISFDLKNKRKIKQWIADVAKSENKNIGEINFIFCSDAHLLDINKKYLNHNYFTDVITFDFCEGVNISGDIFISIDTVRANAIEYKQLFDDELHRVMIHGILHLCLYCDSTESEIAVMRSKENIYLKKLTF